MSVTKWAAAVDARAVECMDGWLLLIQRLWIRRDANWLGLQPRVHKQEAMKGFDMQRWMAQSGQANVCLQTAAFYILQSVGLNPQIMWKITEIKNLKSSVLNEHVVSEPKGV